MIKVLFFSSDNTLVSGAFRSMAKLCKLIKDSGKYEPIVIVPNKGNGVTLLNEYGIENHYVRSYRWIVKNSKRNSPITKIITIVKKCLNFLAYFRLRSVTNEIHPDLIHVNSLHVYIGAKVASSLSIPFVWHFRELLDEDQESWFCDNEYKSLLNKAEYCIAISEYVYSRFEGIVDKSRLRMIPNGIDETDFFFERTAVNNEKLNIVCVGNMDGHKGQDTIIKACASLVKKGITNFRVNFVGSGLLEEQYKKMSSFYGLDEYIIFNGKSKNVKKFYQNADIMIMGSKAEAFGRTTVEAMMSGCLILGSNSGATPELLKNGSYGLLFENGDYVKLARLIYSLINDRNSMFRLAKNGQEYALRTYTADKNAKKVMALYKEIGG